MKEKIAKLINVKTIVTFIVSVVFAIKALKGDIPVDSVMAIITMVLAFYFGTQHEKKSDTEDK